MDMPKYCPATQIRKLVAPVSRRALRDWARQGFVRIAKLGQSQQSPALYSVEDVLAVLEKLAQGGSPTRRRRLQV